MIASAVAIRGPVQPAGSWLCDGRHAWCDRAAVYELSIRVNGKREVFGRFCRDCYVGFGVFSGAVETGVRRVA